MLPVGALCSTRRVFGLTVLPKWPLWPHLFYPAFYSVSELRRACFRRARVARAVLPPGALFRVGAFTFPPCAPKSHMRPLPHLGILVRCWSQLVISGLSPLLHRTPPFVQLRPLSQSLPSKLVMLNPSCSVCFDVLLVFLLPSSSCYSPPLGILCTAPLQPSATFPWLPLCPRTRKQQHRLHQ